MDQAQRLRELVETKQPVRVISLSSGKGGVGKTVLSVNIALTMSRYGLRVLVLDADFGLANIDVMLGVSSKYNLSHFLSGEKSFKEIIQKGHEGVNFVSGGSGLEALLNMDDTHTERLVESVTSPEVPIDIVIIDTGAGINDKVMQMVMASSESVVVTTAEPTAVLDAYAMIKMVYKANPTLPVNVIVNKCQGTKEAARVSQALMDFAKKHLDKEINHLGSIMFDHDVTNSIKRQLPLAISDPGGPTSKQIDSIVRMLLEKPIEKEYQGVLSKLFSRLRSF